MYLSTSPDHSTTGSLSSADSNGETLEHVEDIENFKLLFEKVHHSPFAVHENLKCHIVIEHRTFCLDRRNNVRTI